MSRLRYPLLSLGAALLAFAAGVVWGLGPLTERVDGTVETQTRQRSDDQKELQARIRALEQDVAVGTGLVEAVAPTLGADQLARRSVAMFVLPGAETSAVELTKKALVAAGARVPITVTIKADYVDPTKAVSPLEDLALRLVPPGVSFPSGASPIERVGIVLARSTVSSRADEAGKVDPKGAEVLAGLEELGAVAVEGEAGTRTELAVVLAGGPGGAGVADESQPGAAALVRALDAGSLGAVIAGPPASAGPVGVVGQLRRDRAASKTVSTVDVATTAVGPLAVVLALAEQLRGRSGHYGASEGATRVVARVVPAKRG